MLQQLLKHVLRQVAFVTEQLAKQPLGEFGQQLDIGTMSGRQTTTEQFATVVDDQMQFEAKAPATRAASARGETRKDLVLMNAAVVAHRQEGRVDETDPRAASKQAEQVGAQAREHTRHELDEARVTDQRRKLST